LKSSTNETQIEKYCHQCSKKANASMKKGISNQLLAQIGDLIYDWIPRRNWE